LTIDPEWALKAVRSIPEISYDTETSGLGPTDFICGYVVADTTKSVYVPVRHEAGGNIPGDPAEFEAELNDAFAERDRRGFLTVGHNLAFDLKMSHRHNVTTNRRLEDTQINEGLIDDQVMGYSLEESAQRRGVTAKLGAELYVELASRFGGLPDRSSMKHFWRIEGDNPKALEYACGDGITTIELRNAQQKLIEEYGLSQVHALECALIYYLGRLNKRGLRIDMEYAQRIPAIIEAGSAEAKAALPLGLNVNSPKELEAMFRAAGFTDFAKTAGGKPSFAESWLEGNDLGQRVLQVRKFVKLQSSFVEPLVNTHNVNGRVHPTLNQSKGDEHGAIGGRLSCSDPNMQAVTKRNKALGKIVRPLVIPDFGKIFEMDVFQQEPHLFAHYSEDPNLVRGYSSEPPVDMHDLASQITGRERDDAKRLGMGLLTGLGMKELARRMGWTLSQAYAGADEFFGGFPNIKVFQNTAKQVALERGFVRTILGRIANIPDPRFAYRAVSRIIQGSGADHIKTMVLRACQFEEANDGWFQMLLTIHDSLMFQAEPDPVRLKPLVDLVEDFQSPPFNLIVPMPVEIAMGDNWGAASYGDKIKNPKKGGWQDGWR
jgi:DNA polymerase-1